MKKNLIVSVCLVVLCVSCNFLTKEAKLSILLDKECEKSVRIFNHKDTVSVNLAPGEQHSFVYIAEDRIEKQYYINGVRLKLVVAKGDNVDLYLSGEKGESIKIKGGKFRALNDYNLFKALNLKYSWSKEESLLDSLSFEKQMDDIIKQSNQLLEDLSKNNDFDERWIKNEQLSTKYWVLTRKVFYPFMNAAYSYKKVPKVIPSFSKEVVSKEVLNNDEIIIYGGNLIGGLLYNYAKINGVNHKDVPNPASIGNLEMIKELVSNPKVKSLVAQSLLSMQLNEYSDAGIEPILEYFNKNCLDEKVKAEMLAKVDEISVLGPGKPAPEIELIDMDGKVHSLADYRGKKIYIDVWATYCGKCLKEMPNVHQLEKDYKNENWVFLMISLDKDNAKWQKKAKELGHLDRQFIVRNGHESQFNKDYRIGYAPRYIIIDSKGKLVNFNAPFPSDKKTRRIMDKVL
ncbi:TlpA family protein disulfide reductase [Marinifilum sp.]|uniref:TlpA family protein disulfide reductase n=1 Tax=Marinifilum sp. TaxID=2033137 RepID=UPI003BABF848